MRLPGRQHGDKPPRPGDLLPVVVLAAGIVLFVALAGALLYDWHYREVIYPGVRALGTPVGGMTLEEAAGAIVASLPPDTSAVVLRDPGSPQTTADDRTWSVPRNQLGLVPDPVRAATAAFRQGRGGWDFLVPPWIRIRGRSVPVSDLFDAATARATLERLAPEVDVPPVNGDVQLLNGEVVVTEPVDGRQLDVDGTVAKLAALASDPLATEMDVVTTGTAPRFADVAAVANAYRLAVSGPVRLTWRQGQQLAATVAQVKAWVTITPRPNPSGDMVPSIVFDESAIAAWLEKVAPQVDRPKRDARLGYDENTGKVSVLEASQSGQALDVAGSVRRFEEAAYTEERTAELAVVTTSPAVDSAVADELQGKVQILVRASTTESGQPAERDLNILLAAARVDGVTLAPDQELSFKAALGDVDAASGFDMAQVEGADGQFLGGGIEQVATGFFRAALWAGLVVTERHAPPWRAAWTEPPIGLDAAVSAGTDLRFVNGTEGYLVFGCRIDADRGALITTVVGAPPARAVQLVGPLVEALVAPPAALVQSDSGLPVGRREQVEWARQGADVSYQRVVREGGVELFRDAVVSRYQAAGDVVIVGTGQ